MGLARQDAPLLKRRLDGLLELYGPAYIDTDPIGMVHAFEKREDREVAAFFAAALAFGRVASIRASLSRIFERLGESPRDRLLRFESRKEKSLFRGLVHRWASPTALAGLAGLLGNALRESGSLEAFFMRDYRPGAPTLQEALADFRRRLFSPFAGKAKRKGLDYLVPDPDGNAACKRLHLFLRWMIRPQDGVDLGLWRGPRTSQLTIPLDTHIARIGLLIGLTDRRTPDRRMAEEITDSLRLLDPADPVRYDFAISRMGILGRCPSRRDLRLCAGCPLQDACRHWRDFSPQKTAAL